MIFTSDNWAGAHPAISEALTRHATGFSAAYGTGDLDRQVEATFNQIFEQIEAGFDDAMRRVRKASAASAAAGGPAAPRAPSSARTPSSFSLAAF